MNQILFWWANKPRCKNPNAISQQRVLRIPLLSAFVEAKPHPEEDSEVVERIGHCVAIRNESGRLYRIMLTRRMRFLHPLAR